MNRNSSELSERYWLEPKSNGFELRSKGIFPPREKLVALVAEALKATGDQPP